MKLPTKFVRIENSEIKVLGGVASGLAYSFGIQVWFTRGIFILASIFTLFLPIVVYMLLWMLLPKLLVTKEDFNSTTSGTVFSDIKNNASNDIYNNEKTTFKSQSDNSSNNISDAVVKSESPLPTINQTNHQENQKDSENKL